MKGSIASMSKSTYTSVGRTDRTEVILFADHKGFGFMLQGPTYASEVLSVPPYISCIDHGSPAERCRILLCHCFDRMGTQIYFSLIRMIKC